MSRKVIHSDNAPRAIGPYSQAVAFGNLLFAAGQIPLDPATNELVPGGVTEQTTRVCENIKAAVETAGGTMDDICRVDVYVRNMEHFDAIHKVRREFFKPPAPASTMVEISKMTSPEYLIEINAIAVLND